jgi:hypothetical protein
MCEARFAILSIAKSDRTNTSVPAGTLSPRWSAGIQLSCYAG